MDNEKPPNNKSSLDIGAGIIPTDGSMVRRFKVIRELLGDWSVCPVRNFVSSRCLTILKDI